MTENMPEDNPQIIPETEREIEVVQETLLTDNDGFQTPRKTTRKIIPTTSLKTHYKFAGQEVEGTNEDIVQEERKEEEDLSGVLPMTSTPVSKSSNRTKLLC
jgi:hypothetical protein